MKINYVAVHYNNSLFSPATKHLLSCDRSHFNVIPHFTKQHSESIKIRNDNVNEINAQASLSSFGNSIEYILLNMLNKFPNYPFGVSYRVYNLVLGTKSWPDCFVCPESFRN